MSTSFVVINHTSLKKVLPRYKQHVDCATRNSKVLHHCYTVFKDVYLGESDHGTVVLIPTYKQKLKTLKPTKKTVRRQTDESTEALRGCLESTDWYMFKEAYPDLDEYADTVTSYISWCEEVCTKTKNVTLYSNDKPWFTRASSRNWRRRRRHSSAAAGRNSG